MDTRLGTSKWSAFVGKVWRNAVPRVSNKSRKAAIKQRETARADESS